MVSQEKNVHMKKRGRGRPPTGRNYRETIPVRLTEAAVAAIDGWIERQPEPPSRSEAIRRLIGQGLVSRDANASQVDLAEAKARIVEMELQMAKQAQQFRDEMKRRRGQGRMPRETRIRIDRLLHPDTRHNATEADKDQAMRGWNAWKDSGKRRMK
jgi:Arc/MetJ-type ribon-helix-helix transcriptional regulator